MAFPRRSTSNNAIGSPITDGTAKSVLFVDTGAVLAQDNANLSFDNTANMLALATAGTASFFDIFGNSVLDIGVSASRNLLMVRGASNSAGEFVLLTMGGTFASPVAAATSAAMGILSFCGYGDDNDVHRGAQIKGVVEGTVAGANVPGRLEFHTTNTSALLERLRITSATTAALAALDANTSVGIAGQLELQAPLFLKGIPFASLPASPIAGMVAYITDSNTVTWGATIAGSSTNKVLGWYNGTNWTVAGK